MGVYFFGFVAVFIKVLPFLLLTVPIYFGTRAVYDRMFWGKYYYLFKGEKRKWMAMVCASLALFIGVLNLLVSSLIE